MCWTHCAASSFNAMKMFPVSHIKSKSLSSPEYQARKPFSHPNYSIRNEKVSEYFSKDLGFLEKVKILPCRLNFCSQNAVSVCCDHIVPITTINSNTQSWLVAKSEQSTKLSKQSFPIWGEGLSEETFLFISTFGFHPYLLELKKNLVRNVHNEYQKYCFRIQYNPL